MTNCAACHNRMVPKEGDIELRIGDQLYLVKNIAFEVCEVCGERVLSHQDSETVFQKISREQYTRELIEMPVLDCAV